MEIRLPYCKFCKKEGSGELINFGRGGKNKRKPRFICRPCNAKRVKIYYQKSGGKEKGRILRMKNRDKIEAKIKICARTMVKYYLKNGGIKKPDHCEKCKRNVSEFSRIEAHHDDYSKPLEIRWLCPPCHYIVGKEKTL